MTRRSRIAVNLTTAAAACWLLFGVIQIVHTVFEWST